MSNKSEVPFAYQAESMAKSITVQSVKDDVPLWSRVRFAVSTGLKEVEASWSFQTIVCTLVLAR